MLKKMCIRDRYQSGRSWHFDRIHGQSYFLPADRTGAATGEEAVFWAVHPIQPDLPCAPAGRVVLAPLSVACLLYTSSLRCRGRNKLIHGEGGRGFPADQRCPSQQQEQRDQGVGQHKKHKSPDAHAAFSVKIEVLRVADGGQHAAKVCCNGLHTDHRDQKGAADIRSQTAQDHERKGNEGQQGNIVGDEHASEKAQPDQYQRQLKGCLLYTSRCV